MTLRTFQPKVYLDGQELEALGLKDHLFSVEIRQDDCMADMAIVELWNKGSAITDTDIFRERGNLDVWIGIGGTFEYMGRFIIQRPTYGFPERDAPTIRLIGFDESIKLKEKGERRRTFRNITDSEITTQIAAEYSLLSEVETTQERRSQVNQLDMSDLTFLAKLAKRNGYILYIEDKTLHFHQVKFDDTRLELNYGEGENELIDFWPTKTLLSTANTFITSILDKDLGTVLTARSIVVPDAFTQQETRSSPTYRAPSSVIIPSPTRYISPVDGATNVMTLQDLANRKAQKDLYVLSGWGKTNGNPKIKARRAVRISGIGHLSGYYYVKSVMHYRDDSEGYITRFFAVKTRMGLQKRLPPSIAGSQTPSNRNPGQSVQPDVIAEVSL